LGAKTGWAQLGNVAKKERIVKRREQGGVNGEGKGDREKWEGKRRKRK
jgi:hypothetical protein